MTAILIAFVLFLFPWQVTISITRPVAILLGIVQNINASTITENIPPMTGGSREVNQVYVSFDYLFCWYLALAIRRLWRP